MRISSSQMEKILLNYTRNPGSQTEKLSINYSQKVKTPEMKTMESVKIKVKVDEKTDSLAISIKTKVFQKARQLYAQLPEIRQERVEEAQERLETGNQPSSEEIAVQIVRRYLADGQV